jgi:ClpP class serine protease
MELIQLQNASPSDEDLQKLVAAQVEEDLAGNSLLSTHNLIFLFDTVSIARVDTDKIYKTLVHVDKSKPILLIVDSPGGNISAAYFIAKLCREYTAARFEVAVPRRAKSAATLICCGADLVHLGSLSELGPIDPQFGDRPALALKHSIEHIAELCKRYPAASEMFASYLSKSLQIEALGYYERVAESAVQYAERLLRSRHDVVQDEETIAIIANRLVYAYKDHGFAIDANEARQIFGPDVIKYNSPEYVVADKVYRSLGLIDWIMSKLFDRRFSFTGTVDKACSLQKRTRK